MGYVGMTFKTRSKKNLSIGPKVARGCKTTHIYMEILSRMLSFRVMIPLYRLLYLLFCVDDCLEYRVEFHPEYQTGIHSNKSNINTVVSPDDRHKVARNK